MVRKYKDVGFIETIDFDKHELELFSDSFGTEVDYTFEEELSAELDKYYEAHTEVVLWIVDDEGNVKAVKVEESC